MSAYVVDRAHIHALVTASLIRGIGGINPHFPDGLDFHGDAAAAGQMLWNENFRSVAYRYSKGETTAPEYHFTPRRFPLSPVDVLQAIRGLRYQSCECPDYATTKAARWLACLEASAIATITERSQAWSISDADADRQLEPCADHPCYAGD
jgi:hypothetical protein